ncbi:sugar ABC transporter ATP-binding protein [Salipiger mangrovisoli]|uniref:Sugar ABC transporter ATP-binding protein n=1 Tax=Salipiger mangrovisoli TaxID=2865933 RepID=A0ABR9X8H1_9RHOB|nr:sugar ABC transporter ATP-binding protein [Salipiger mangrovisoli]MBE9639794.1 sugar ABC transporter ATP-binding protein [Salipiger mangrovisoli]
MKHPIPKDRPVIARLEGCTKQYPGVLALDSADFELREGQVRALLGKNGAGKSTLIRLLTGAEEPDTGIVTIDDTPLSASGAQRAAEAYSHGVRVVYQELSLVPDMSVAENLFLGRWPGRGGMIDMQALHEEARHALDSLGLDIDPQQPVSILSPAERQLVEIARVLPGKPRMVILDEPTSSLADAEARKVLAAVDRISAAGIAVVYVSHRMNEIRQIADSVTVMRDGRIIETVDVEGADTQEIVRLMLGASGKEHDAVVPAQPGPEILRVDALSVQPKIADVGFSLRAGEVLGIAGLLGSGRTEILEAIMGVRPSSGGTVSVDGKPVSGRSFRKMKDLGFGFTPESRKDAGIVPLLGVDENTVVTDWSSVTRSGVLQAGLIAEATRRVIERLHVKTARTDSAISTLSGGNQQKVVIGRWVHAGSRVLLLDEPTRGVDVEAKAQIYQIVRELAAEGKAVLFVSSEIEELPLVCDRVLVLREGRIAEEMTAPDIHQDAIFAACLASDAA